MEEALTEAVAPTPAGLAVVAVDSTAATDISAARVLVAACRPRHDKGLAVRLEVLVD